MPDTEKVYDEFVGPLLEKAMKRCAEHGIPMIAACQIANNGEQGIIAQTVSLPKAESLTASMRLAVYGVRCNGNADSLIKALLQDGAKWGHNSVFLSILEREFGNEETH